MDGIKPAIIFLFVLMLISLFTWLRVEYCPGLPTFSSSGSWPAYISRFDFYLFGSLSPFLSGSSASVPLFGYDG